MMRHQNKVMFGGLIGNLVESYDISLCYYLAYELSRTLTGDTSGSPTVILTLTFLAYLTKPFGAFCLGLLSDKYGRKQVLTFSILIMGLSTSAMGLIPSFERIGFFATGLFLTFRMIQSMALGSEFLNSASFLVESGNAAQRGFRGCWTSVGVKVGSLLALVMTECTHLVMKTSGYDFAWRIPFLLAILTTLIGVAIRYSLPESLSYVVYYADRAKPTTHSIYQRAFSFIKRYPFLFNYAFFTSFMSVASGFFFYLYIPMHAAHYTHLPNETITYSTLCSLLTVIVFIPLFGWYSDKTDRLKLLTFATAGIFILAYPFMVGMNSGNPVYFITMQVLISIPCACYYSVASVILIEIFPLPIRCTALSIVFSIAGAMAASIPPLLADFLARATSQPNSPCLIIMLIAALILNNIRLLTRDYRSGQNEYAVEQFAEDTPVFTMRYQETS